MTMKRNQIQFEARSFGTEDNTNMDHRVDYIRAYTYTDGLFNDTVSEVI